MEEIYSLKAQKVLIIGGTSGMGLETARLSATLGADVIISSRSEQKLQAAAAAISSKVEIHPADATNSSDVENMLKALAPLDHIVVTASSGGFASSITATAPNNAQPAFGRFWISYNLLHHAPKFVKKTGSVALLSGSSGRRPVAGYGFWGSLHGSIKALARSAALELAPIRVNVVSPGGIGLKPDRQLVPRVGQPLDIAKAFVLLMTNPAMTDAVIDVDSGERLGTWSGE